jgi:hypothetical protein
MSEGIHTLQEFMLQTKGMLYILAVCYLVGFVYFWKFLNKSNKKRDSE